jgi:hypothetical protein
MHLQQQSQAPGRAEFLYDRSDDSAPFQIFSVSKEHNRTSTGLSSFLYGELMVRLVSENKSNQISMIGAIDNFRF